MRRLMMTLLFVALAVTVAATASADLITGLAISGTDLAAQGSYYTGQIFEQGRSSDGMIPDYEVGTIDEDVYFFSDRRHEYNGNNSVNTLASLGLVGAEYIMSANNNKGKTDFQMDITVGATVDAYMLSDTRYTPPAWLAANGWVDLNAHRIGIDETPAEVGPGNGINREFFVFKKASIAAGTFSTYENSGSGNMYGVIITAPGTPGLTPIDDPIKPWVATQPAAFTYDSATGEGTISGDFQLESGVVVTLSADMPAPTFFDPNPGHTPAGSIGSMTELSGDHNTSGAVPGLDWSGTPSVTLTGSKNGIDYSVEVPMIFGPSGDSGYTSTTDPWATYDPILGPDYKYNASVTLSDLVGVDGDFDTGTWIDDSVEPPADMEGQVRFALWMGVGKEAENGRAHRLTQNRKHFGPGEDTYERDVTNKTTKYAAFAPLSFYYGLRDARRLGPDFEDFGGSVQLDTMFVEGALAVDTTAIVPEPSTFIMLIAGALLGLAMWRRRR